MGDQGKGKWVRFGNSTVIRWLRGAMVWALPVVCLVAHAQQQKTAPAGSARSQAPKTAPETAAILSSYEGQKVTGIQIAGQPEAKTSDYASLFVQHEGEPFAVQKVQQTVDALKATGKFKEVQIQVDPEAQGVRVLFVLEPATYFGIFTFPGAEQFAYSRLIQISNFPPQAPFNADDIAVDRDNLLNFFRQEGYFQATVTPEVQLDTAHGLANVLFRTDLKKKAKFGQVDIAGVSPAQASSLDDRLKTLGARLRGSAIRPGKTYHHGTLNKANTFLQNRLVKENHLSARVQMQGAEYNAETNRADIHFDIHEGPPIKVDIEGAHLWSWSKKSLLPMYQGVGVDPESVQEGQQALTSYFQGKGYFDVAVSSQFSRKPNHGEITILYKIEKKDKHKVTSVRVAGNKAMPDKDLMPRVTVQKAHFYSHGSYSEKLVRGSVNNLEALYKSEGFSNVKVVPKVTRQSGNVLVAFDVTEGPRDIVNTLRIEGADTFPEAQFAPNGLKLAPGKPYSQRFVEDDRANIVAHYLQAGYLTSNFRQTAAVVSKSDPHHIDVVYHIYEGPRVFTGDVITMGRVHTQQKLIDRDVNPYIQPAQPLTEGHLLTAESSLYDHTGVFDWAEIDPRRQITTQNKEDVLVKVHEAKKNQITYGFGFELINRGGSIPSGTVALPNLPPVGLPSSYRTNQQTFYGPRGTFQYTRNNFRGKGESLSFTAFAGRLDQRLAAYYIDPNLRWSLWKSTFAVSGERDEENPIYSSQQELGSYQIQRTLDKKKTNTLFLRYSFSKTKLTRVEIDALVPEEDRNVRLSTIAANLTHDTRDNALDAHKGMLDSIEVDYNAPKLGSSVDFAKLTAQAAYYKPIFHQPNLIWANSVRIGLAQPVAGSRVPLSEKFFTGGGNTLRGFPLDGAGPQQAVCLGDTGNSVDCDTNPNASRINVPTGGDELLLINSELRFPLGIKKGLGMAAFYDGGNVFSTVGFHDFTSLYSNNVGLGLRYATPVGPVRVDLGRNLNPIPGINATQYFISIGQAF
ncbi:POTRA domain-containing protein [Silvibacterium acidisoli]|uniref:POTRA domain-containing protein n=1 Tax=Acidobacteriaceae bacterium ZG23-2 TaxID=2883246 RepID=UPI00406C357E